MRELIAAAPAVTVNAAVGTSPIDVHPVIPASPGKDPFRVHKVHNDVFSPPAEITDVTFFNIQQNIQLFIRKPRFTELLFSEFFQYK